MGRGTPAWHSTRNLTPRVMRDYLRTQLWPVPLAGVIVSVVLAQLLTWLDHQVDEQMPPALSGLLFSGGAPAARSLMEAIAASTITVTSLTFSLTVVTLQLASSQYSPRLLRTFTSDSFVHNTLALFLSTFAFALTVLRTIRDNDGSSDGFVPEISVTLSFLLALATVIGLVLFLGHLSRQLRVERMLAEVREDFMATVAEVSAEDTADSQPPKPGVGAMHIEAQSSGFLVEANEQALLATAEHFDAVIAVAVPAGDFLVEGVPFAQAWRADGRTTEAWTADELEDLRNRINGALSIGFERNSVQDIGFPLQQMLDVAVRAISPSVNDPTTCVHALGHLAAGLSTAAREDRDHRMLCDDQGRTRVVTVRRTFAMLLELVVSQICTYGMDDPRVAGRLVQLLSDLAHNDTADRHRSVIEQQRQRVIRALERSNLDPVDRQNLVQACGSGESSRPGQPT